MAGRTRRHPAEAVNRQWRLCQLMSGRAGGRATGWRRSLNSPRWSAGLRAAAGLVWCAIWTGDVRWRGSAPERERGRAYTVSPVHYLLSVHISTAASSSAAPATRSFSPLPAGQSRASAPAGSPLAGICHRWPAVSRHRSHNPPVSNTATTHWQKSRGSPLACGVLPSCISREPSIRGDNRSSRGFRRVRCRVGPRELSWQERNSRDVQL